MKKIQILGTGCPKCKALTQNAETAAIGPLVEVHVMLMLVKICLGTQIWFIVRKVGIA
jgi:ACR3 family arsenite efflux pump ArsB